MTFAKIGNLFLPLVGIVLAGLGWWYASTLVTDLPSPMKTWEESKLYILEPWPNAEKWTRVWACSRTTA